MTRSDDATIANAARLRAAGFGPGSVLGGLTRGGNGSVVITVPQVRPPGPPRHHPICMKCDEYNVVPGHQLLTCATIRARLELDAGEEGCCHGQAIVETIRVQDNGGCPLGKF